jgi:RecA-family ATPase
MAVAGETIDYVTVADALPSWGVVGLDIRDLAKWSANVPTAASAPFYARIVKDAAVSRSLHLIAGKMLDPEADPATLIPTTLEALRDLRDRDLSVQDLQAVRSLREILDVPEDEDVYDWVIPDLLESRDRFILTGSEGGGKSTLLRQMCVLAAAGIHPFTYRPIPPIRVLVIDAENSEKQWRRTTRGLADKAAMMAIPRGGRDPRDGLMLECVTKQMDITRPGDLGDLHRLMDESNPAMLMIGPLYRLVPRAIKDDDDAAPVLAALDSLRERGVAMLIEAHAGHTSVNGERDLRPRGSSALLGWPEFGYGLRRDKQVQDGRVPFSLVHWRGDRDARPWPKRLTRGAKGHPQNWPWEPAY